MLREVKDGIAKISPCVVGDGCRDSFVMQLVSELIQREAALIRSRRTIDEWSVELSTVVGDSGDIDRDGLEVDRRRTRGLSEMEHGIKPQLQVFVETLLEPFQINWIATCGQSFRESVDFEHLRKGFPARVFTPLVVRFKGGYQDLQGDARFFTWCNDSGFKKRLQLSWIQNDVFDFLAVPSVSDMYESILGLDHGRVAEFSGGVF